MSTYIKHDVIRAAIALALLGPLGLLVFGCGAQPEDGGAAVSPAPTVSESEFGTMPDGEKIARFTLTNGSGVEVKIITYGGIITSIRTPDRNGELGNIVLGFDELQPYLDGTPYFGALIGRYGNRIAKGSFTIDGVAHQLDTNDGANHLHGGLVGFDKKVWSAEPFAGASSAGVKLSLVSGDGDQGYPGTLDVTATYSLTNDNELITELHATTDKPTIVNLTQHSYFNLAGEGTILDHELMIGASHFTPVDATLIPTGASYDHNFVLDRETASDLELAARVAEPISGRVLEVFTEEPGIQFYSGNFLDGSLRSGDRVFAFRSGLCLEPQHYPDSPNQPGFPPTILRPGQVYSTRMAFRFSTQ